MLKSLEISLEPSTSNGEHIASVATPPSTYFHCRKLNDTTFQIVEDDKWREHPFIYAKVYDSVIVLIDTGCGGASKSEIPGMQLRSLRHFIETYPVSVNGNKPLNPGSEKGYVVICTHCHYDHIGGIEQFKDAPKSVIWASGYDKEFIGDQAVLPIHSLCQFVGMKTPQYKVTHWATDGEPVKYDTVDLGLVIYHTPGHTPDGLAILDTKERVLFVGDFAYEWAPIVFTLEGSVSLYKDSLNKLHNLVRKLNASDEKNGKLKNDFNRVSLASGHITSRADAEEFLDEVSDFLHEVEQGKIEPRVYRSFRGEEEVLYEKYGGQISFAGSRKKFAEATSRKVTRITYDDGSTDKNLFGASSAT